MAQISLDNEDAVINGLLTTKRDVKEKLCKRLFKRGEEKDLSLLVMYAPKDWSEKASERLEKMES